jgi:hypothetical protein
VPRELCLNTNEFVLYVKRMIFVEHMAKAVSLSLPTTWASDIVVESSLSDLHITGKLPMVESDLQPSRDAFRRYLSSVKSEFGQKRASLPSPHISFANAVSDDALIGFVSEFGPVAVKDVVEVEQTQQEGMWLEDFGKRDWRTSIGAVQNLATLRRERQTYASALELLGELMRGEDAANVTAIQRHISAIADGVWYWPEQWEAERQWRASHSSAPIAWHFEPNRRDYICLLKYDALHPEPPRKGSLARQELDDPIGTHTAWFAMLTETYRAGHLVLCELINAFDTEVQYFGDRAVEALPFGSLRFGIRPALYLILKHLYLGRAGAKVCSNDRCRRFFESEREGQVYCSIECSQRYRQRQYWAKWGAAQRAKRNSRKGRKRAR